MNYADTLIKNLSGDYDRDVAFLMRTHDRVAAVVEPRLERGEMDEEIYSVLCEKLLPTRLAILAAMYLRALRSDDFEYCATIRCVYDKTEKALEGLRKAR